MSKNILILAGSPRKGGNSDLLCAEFARGAAEAGHTVQTIRVHELGLAYCLAASTARTTAESVSTRTAWPKS